MFNIYRMFFFSFEIGLNGQSNSSSDSHHPIKKSPTVPHMEVNPPYQGRIQACFDRVQPLWAPKKTVQIFLQVQINNRIFR